MNGAFRHQLGDKARDRISGLTGIITARADHLFGCARYWISPQETKDGKPCDGAWFDEDAIEVVEVASVKAQRYRVVEVTQEPTASLRRAGGPVSQPASHATITSR